MNIWLIDFDGKIGNLALMRISAYHKTRGNIVTLKRAQAQPDLFSPLPDKSYLSCIFKWNERSAKDYAANVGNCELGGTGIDASICLPSEINNCSPDYSLYGIDHAIGFISRGCIRKCPWCVVPSKEGYLQRVSTAQELVGNMQEAIFLDNNFLALKDCANDLQWLAENKIAIDFNQGLDARLVTPEIAKLLAACKWSKGMRFSLDTHQNIKQVRAALELLRDTGVNLSGVFVFCLIGFDGLTSDIERLLLLREFNVSVFPMGFRDLTTGDEPANGWDKKLYRKYRRLITRLPHAVSVWDDFRKEVCAAIPNAH